MLNLFENLDRYIGKHLMESNQPNDKYIICIYDSGSSYEPRFFKGLTTKEFNSIDYYEDFLTSKINDAMTFSTYEDGYKWLLNVELSGQFFAEGDSLYSWLHPKRLTDAYIKIIKIEDFYNRGFDEYCQQPDDLEQDLDESFKQYLSSSSDRFLNENKDDIIKSIQNYGLDYVWLNTETKEVIYNTDDIDDSNRQTCYHLLYIPRNCINKSLNSIHNLCIYGVINDSSYVEENPCWSASIVIGKGSEFDQSSLKLYMYDNKSYSDDANSAAQAVDRWFEKLRFNNIIKDTVELYCGDCTDIENIDDDLDD